MKKILSGLIALAGLLSLNSCSKVINTHEQVMVSYRTKTDVTRQFGQPDEKMEANGITEWLYNCEAKSALKVSKTKVAINGQFNSVYLTPNHNSSTVTQFTPFDKHVKFTFDEKGSVLTWDSYGVNFAEKKTKVGATIAVVAGATAAAVAICYVAILANGIGDLGLNYGK